MFLTSNQLSTLDLSKNLSVKANAGSGKTAVLVERFVKILLKTDLKKLNSIVGITFTEKAATELRSRIFKKLLMEKQKEETVSDFHLSNLLERISSIQIGTIHSFCSSILREFSNETGLDSNFNILQGMDEVMMLDEVIENTLRSIINRTDGSPERSDLEELIKIYGLKKVKNLLKEFMSERETVVMLTEKVYSVSTDEIFGQWLASITDFTEKLIKHSGLVDYLHGKGDIWDTELSNYISLFRDSKSLQERCYYFDLIYISIYSKSTGEIKKTFLKKNEAGLECDFIAIHNKMKSVNNFKDFINFFSDLSPDYSHLKYHIEITKKLLNIFGSVLEQYKHHKDLNAQLDFEDLLIRTRDLLKNENISSALKERYEYILVDEYQDTNYLQSQILYSLLGDISNTNLFIVGDPKQSIYGFRNAEVEIFSETEMKIIDERSGSKILLDESFRLLSDIIVFTNYLFKKTSVNDPFNTIPYQELIMARDCDYPGRIELLLYHEKETLANCEEEMLSRKILDIMGSNQLIYEIGSIEPRKMEYGDIAILLRSRTHLDSLEQALIKYNIPYIITSGIGYYQTQEIFDLYNYLSFLINPKNDLALVGILRSPFFYIPDSELFEISISGNGRKSFWEKILIYVEKENVSRDLKKAVDVLKENIDISQRVSIPNLINKIVTETNWFGVLSFQDSGKQTLANLNKFLVIARDFEGKGFNTLFDFVEKLKALVTEEEKEGQAVIDPTNQMVKIMTIHAAKGLEFPVLFLPFAHQDFKPDTEPYFNKSAGIGFATPQLDNLDIEYDHSIASKYIRALNRLKSDSEERRILYVALTRAHNMLFISGKYEPFKNGRNYLTWIKDALGLDELYIEPPVGEEKSSKKKENRKEIIEPFYPFLKSDNVIIRDDLKTSHLKDDTYVRDTIKDYELKINITQGLQDFNPVTLPDTFEEASFNKHIAAGRIEKNISENVLSATAMQTYIDCEVKYYLKFSLGFPESLLTLENYNLFQNQKNSYSIEEFETGPIDPDIISETDSPIILSGTMRGKILHSVLEHINDIADNKATVNDLVIRTLSQYYFNPDRINKNEQNLLIKIISSFMNSNTCKTILQYGKFMNEFNLSCAFKNDILTVSIDRLCETDQKIVIVDYKTNKIGSKKLNSLRKMYSNQMLFYAYLASRYFEIEDIETILIFLEKPDEVIYVKYSAEEFQKLESILDSVLTGIKAIENGTRKPEKRLSSCALCDYFNGKECVY